MVQITSKQFVRPISEVSKQPTPLKALVSEKTGKEYTAEVAPQITAHLISLEERNGKYAYHITDVKNDLQYTIKAPNKIEARFGSPLLFTNVKGGVLNSGGVWFSSDSVAILKQNA